MATDPSQRSVLREFLTSIAAISGDLSNITAPPFVLSTQSTTELPSYWAEYPSILAAPTAASSPEDRALLVLKWFIVCLHRQQFGGRKESNGVKKPLNAFLGELFVADWPNAELGDTHLISEQVSHHPPITACCLWNDKYGVRAEGYACQEITFNGNVNVKQMGHAVMTLEKHNETYLIPLPDVKISGILTGNPYPELSGHYAIPSSSGFVSTLDFSGKRVLGMGGTKHHVHAAVYKSDDTAQKSPVYELEGQWTGEIILKNASGEKMDTLDVGKLEPSPLSVPEREQQSPYESRRAWGGVIDALDAGDMGAVVKAKSKVEDAQRSQRAKREEQKTSWEAVFFERRDSDPAFEALSSGMSSSEVAAHKSHGFWRFKKGAEGKARPYREGTPCEP